MCAFVQHEWSGSRSVTICGGISMKGRTAFYRLDNGTLTAIKYQDVC